MLLEKSYPQGDHILTDDPIKNCMKRGFALGKATNAQTSLHREGRPEIALLSLASKSDTPHKPQLAEPKKKKKKKESRFQPIDRWTQAISGGGSNQREPPVLTGSPSPCASVDTFFSPISRAPEEQRQSRRNHSGGKSGESRVSVALGDISRPDQPSGACSAYPLDRTCRRATGTSWTSSLLLRGMVPC
jgi:hypothetical protein